MVPGSSQSSPPQPVTVGVRTGGGTDSSGVFHKCQPSGLPVSRPKAAGTCPRPLPARWVEPQGPSLPAWPLITPPFPLSPSPAIVFTGAVNWAPTVCQVIASFREPPSSHYLLGKGERKKKKLQQKKSPINVPTQQEVICVFPQGSGLSKLRRPESWWVRPALPSDSGGPDI